MYVATQSFFDDDGDFVGAGSTVVSREADVFKAYPERFEPIETTLGGMPLFRVGGATTLEPSRPRRPRRPRPQASERERPYDEVELIERYVGYAVDLAPAPRQTIIEEIARAHREAGRPIETGGWLFSRHPARADRDSIEITRATTSATQGSATRVYLRDPEEVLAELQRAGLGRGGDLPSMQDARAWAGTMDKLAADCYVSLVVYPSESLGWMVPRFSAWVAGRHGGQPLVGRARLVWE